jgi:CTP:molybdopterin cytidylyltransferase MocA
VIAGIVLAAGAASRFGEPKQRLLLPRVLARLEVTSLDEIVVVSGPYQLEAGGARLIPCPEWERGPGASLRCGLAALSAETRAAVVCLADGPNLAPAAVDRVLEAWRVGEGDVVAASYGGDRGHPVVLGRSAWDSVPDEGMRALPATLVPCDDLGAPGDVDSPEDLE